MENELVEQEPKPKQLGCKHYERACSIYADCCKKWYSCRLCHNRTEAHEIDRFKIQLMKCLHCSTEQTVAKQCASCEAVMSDYFCATCNFFDNKGEKKGVYHCDECGICRVGGRDKFYHCKKCGACYSNELKDAHKCLEDSLRQDCAICLEYMFESRNQISILKCGHAFHGRCLNQALKRAIGCPICRTTMFDMTQEFEQLRKLVRENPETEEQNVTIHCNDCQNDTSVMFNRYGLECQNCSSFNTVRS